MVTDYSQYNDTDLLQGLSDSKERALVELYNRYWDKLFVVAANLLDSAEEAEECVQNVFLSLWKRRETLLLSHSLNTYLSVSVKYQSFSMMARNHRRHAQAEWDDAIDVADTTSPEGEYIAKELQQRIEQSINRLPPKCQLAFRMSREQGMAVKAIAEELHLSENTVKMHLKNANKKLKNDLLILIPMVLVLFIDKDL
ncbi:RNA polymerase sigma-70 factor [Parapedobacter tibetensis]|uniref:RNA polymerase sigma-70 factor n=1 Tax=Parapedobacter tibetensis TaxID=2972951 RepID=UPI00214D56ED|nr:RNA polymerase sigma-70 factor [Parapedobacter tibetensis]